MGELERIRQEYASRAQRLAGSDVYSLFNRANLFIVQQRQREVLTALKKNGITGLSNLRILEMGCGGGGVLTEVLGFGASPENLYGVDLLFDRLLHAITSFRVQALPMQMDSPCRSQPKPSTWFCNTPPFPPFSIRRFAAIFAPNCCVYSEVPTPPRESPAA